MWELRAWLLSPRNDVHPQRRASVRVLLLPFHSQHREPHPSWKLGEGSLEGGSASLRRQSYPGSLAAVWRLCANLPPSPLAAPTLPPGSRVHLEGT